MKHQLLLRLGVFLTVFTGACEKSGGGSQVKLDGKTADKLAEVSIDEVDMKAICDTNTLVVFVGNAEKVGLTEIYSKEAMPKDFQKKAQANDEAFVAAIQKSWRGLQSSMRQSDCWKREKAGLLTLAKIYDGPGGGDSEVEIVNFVPEGRKVKESLQKYQVKLSPDTKKTDAVYNVTLDPTEQSKFEINMPRSISSIILQIFGMNAKGYHQIYYIFKTHGGVYSSLPNGEISLFNRLAPNLQNPVFLFDNFGPDGDQLRSNMFSPFWFRDHACEIYKNSTHADAKRYLAQECPQVASTAAKGWGTSGDEGGSSGVDGGSSGVDGGSSGVDGGSSGVDGGSSGAGKGGLFFGELPNFKDQPKDKPAENKPDGVLLAGEAATYSSVMKGLTGVAGLKLVTGTQLSGYNTVLLDTCYGSPIMMDSVKRFWGPIENYLGSKLGKVAKGVAPARLTVLANQAPIYYDLIGYDKLPGHVFLGLPLLLYKGEKEKNEKYQAVMQAVNAHFENGLEVTGEEAKKNQVLRDYDRAELKKLHVSFKELHPSVSGAD